MLYENILIKELDSSDLSAICSIHMERLPDDFLPSLGKLFLENIYYSSSINNPYGKVFVAKDHIGNVLGFVNVSTESSKFLRYIFKKNLLKVIWFAFMLLLKNPKRILESIDITTQNMLENKHVGEIMFIAVSKGVSGSGIGTKLVKVAENYLSDYNKKCCGTKTLANNLKVILFYKKMGYEPVKRFICGKKEYVWIEWDLNEQ